MGILKKIFSRFVIVALLILIEFGVILFLAFYAYVHLLPISVACRVLAILIVVFVVNKEESPEMKLPWIVVLLAVPVAGILTFFLFGNNRLRKREKKFLNYGKENSLKYRVVNKNSVEEYDSKIRHNTNLFNYLRNIEGDTGFFDNHITYFKDGESFFEDAKKEMEKAKKFILIESFIIGLGKLWDEIHEILLRKVKEGVKVRILYDDVGSNPYIYVNYYRRLRKEGMEAYVFNPMKPIMSGIYNNRDHRKIIVVDHTAAYTGGLNIRDEYINYTHPFGYWKDVGIKVQGNAIKSFIIFFLSMFDMTRREQSDYDFYLEDPYEKYNEDGFIFPFVDGPNPFYSDQIGENTFVHMIENAKKRIYISTPYLICSHRLMSALRNAALRGVDVKLTIPGIPDKKLVYWMTFSSIKSLLESGVKVYKFTPGFNHAKIVSVDGNLSFVGTINFDYRSLVHHYEDGAIIYDSHINSDIDKDYEEMISKSEQITLLTYKFSSFNRLICAFLQLFSPLL